MINTILQRFSNGPGILANPVHLRETPTLVGPETTGMKAVRAARGMMYADDTCIVSRSSEGPATVMTVVLDVCEASGPTESEKKAETMATPTRRETMEPIEIKPAG